jgi:serine/threonine-protein kinase
MIDVVTFATGERKTLVRGGVSARYLASGHLVYVNKTTLFAVPFDLGTLSVRGAAVPILDDVGRDLAAGAAQYDVSRDGTLVYRSRSGAAAAVAVQWLDSAGKVEPLIAKPAIYLGTPRLSPDGARVAMAIRDGNSQEIWVYDPRRDTMTRLTFGDESFVSPVWTPDGKYVIFGSIGNGMFWTRADGAGRPQPLLPTKGLQFPTSVSRDGKYLAFFHVDGTPQLWSARIGDDGASLKAEKPVQFLKSQFADIAPAFSPDGRWMAYASNESGKFEVYVRAFSAAPSGKEGKWQVSNNGGETPAWSPNGRELLYSGAGQIMAVSYTASAEAFLAEKPRVWANMTSATGFDIAPDGKRVVLLMPSTTQEPARQEHTIVLVQNFFDELRRRAPVSR